MMDAVLQIWNMTVIVLLMEKDLVSEIFNERDFIYNTIKNIIFF